MPVEPGSYDGAATIARSGEPGVEVHCRISVTRDAWHGTFRARGLLPSRGEATLTLPDGWSGQIVVAELDVLAGRATFTGLGDAPDVSS